MDGPSFMFSHGKVFARAGRTGSGARIVLPLADDGVRPDGLLGAIVYPLGITPTARDGVDIDRHNEIVTHYEFTEAGEAFHWNMEPMSGCGCSRKVRADGGHLDAGNIPGLYPIGEEARPA